MKRILFLTCIGSMALTLTALGAHRGKSAHRSGGHKARSAHVVSHGGRHHVSHHVGHATASRHVRHASVSRHSATRHRAHSVARASHNSRNHARRTRTAQTHRNAHASRDHTRVAANRGRNTARTRNAHNPRGTHATATRTARTRTRQENARIANRGRNRAGIQTERGRHANARRTERAQAAQANVRNAAQSNLRANRGRNMTLGTNHVVNYNGENVRIVNDWHEPRFRGKQNYAAFYNYNNNYAWHNRSWWNDHYSRVVFVLGGWWYWNSGYWYPAWGYDPYANYYYNGPIYTGYASLSPDAVIVNVQTELADWGYNPGPIDGILGPRTRAALAAFQSDHGLLVTSAVDRPTLQTLGLT